MKYLKTFESTIIDLDVHYEIRYYDNELHDEVIVSGSDFELFSSSDDSDDVNYNPFDLKDMVKLLLKYENEMSESLYIVKITRNEVTKKEIDDVKLEIEAEKYNL